MASVLVIADEWKGTSLAAKLAMDGHIVKIYPLDRVVRLKGFKNLTYLGNPSPLIEQFDLILGNNESFDIPDGLHHLGGSSFISKLANDSQYQLKVINSLLGEYISPINLSNELIPFTLSCWVDNMKIYTPFFLTLHHERLMPSNIGPRIEMGLVTSPLPDNSEVGKVMMQLLELLVKVKFVGLLSLTGIATQEAITITRISGELSDSLLLAMSELIIEPLFDFLYKLSTNELKGVTFEHHPFHGMAVTLLNPPGSEVNKIKIEPRALKHFHLANMQKDEDDYSLATDDSLIGYITARGDTLRECRRRVYRTLERLKPPKEWMYRIDAGEGIADQLSQLTQWGWV